MSALDVQIGGDHYKNHGIQPVEFIHANKLDFFQGNVIKYVTRWRAKGGLKDLEKAKHYLEMYIELEAAAALTESYKTVPADASAPTQFGLPFGESVPLQWPTLSIITAGGGGGGS